MLLGTVMEGGQIILLIVVYVRLVAEPKMTNVTIMQILLVRLR